MVTDLHHFLDLPAWHARARTPVGRASGQHRPGGNSRRCRHRLGKRAAVPPPAASRRCPGRMIVLRTEPTAPIRWQCSVCDDEGIISNWAGSPFDLRRRRLTLAHPVNEIVIPDEVAAVLRELQLPDADCERLVFRIRAHDGGAVLLAAGDDLDELIGFVAAEANHEPSRRCRQRLDTALDALSDAAQAH